MEKGKKLPVLYIVGQRPKSKAERLLDCALQILRDQCPEDPERYLCKESEFYDETACERCWTEYLFHLMNS